MFIDGNATSLSTPFGGAEVNDTFYFSSSFRSSERSWRGLDS